MKSAILACALVVAATTAAAAAGDVTVTVPMAFPESLASTANGTVYVGSMNLGAVYRAMPGERHGQPPGSASRPAISAGCWACWRMCRATRSMSATINAMPPI